MRPDLDTRVARCLAALRRVVGMPDYAGYLAHHRRFHPGEPIPSEREFFSEFIEVRYGNTPSRCC